ncbi:MAG TPA: CHAT domain-containing protein [Flavisolibacter sp.]|nr:CHAT domain-containing protein [Flavisolibacter sp.]
MKKKILRTSLFALILYSPLLVSIPQKPKPSYAVYLGRYQEAQNLYNKATSISLAKAYGPKEEKLEQQWNEAALKSFLSLYKLLPASIPQFDSLRFHTAFRIGELHHYFENSAEAITYYQYAIAACQRSPLSDSLPFKPYLYTGLIYYSQNKFDTAISYFTNAEKIQAAFNYRLAEGERLYNILGVLFHKQGDYKQALNYFQKALDVLSPVNPYYKELSVNYKINLAQIYLRLEEYEKANTIYQGLLLQPLNKNEIYHNIGYLNLMLGASKKAITYLKKVNYKGSKNIRLYNSIGNAFFNAQQYDSAKHYYEKSIKTHETLNAENDPIGYGLTLKNIGDYEAYFKRYNNALLYYQKSLHQFYPGFSDRSIHANPQNFSGVFSYINLFNSLTAKAEAWHSLYQTTKSIAFAEEELKSYQSAFQLVAYVERTYESDEARLFLNKIKYAIQSKPIDIAFELYQHNKDRKYLDLLYYFDQQNKAAVLSLNHQLNRGKSGSVSPELQKEKALKNSITRLSIEAAQLSDSVRLSALNKEIRDYEIKLDKLRDNGLRKQVENKADIPSIALLQNLLLDGKTAIISYHLSQEKLTGLFITKQEAWCHQRALPTGFYLAMEEEIRRIKTPTNRFVGLKQPDYYSLFFSSIRMDEFEQLIIIPDDILAYFPFETLPAQRGKYLVENVAIQYQFSTALLTKNATDFSNGHTASFAPFAYQGYGDSLPQLPSSGNEISAIDGEKYFDTAATKDAFLRNSSNSTIVHLATHAVSGNRADNLSYIAFAPSRNGGENFLYTGEIYNLSLPGTALVILSACEAGSGNLVKGEGILSLSRAFTYAGCPNVITTLWKADDFSTAYLSTHIHSYLNEGYPITKAVQKAKIDYLYDKAINPRFKQPYYWSHLVFVGAYSPVKNFQWKWVLLPGFCLLVLSVVFIRKYRRSPHRSVDNLL